MDLGDSLVVFNSFHPSGERCAAFLLEKKSGRKVPLYGIPLFDSFLLLREKPCRNLTLAMDILRNGWNFWRPTVYRVLQLAPVAPKIERSPSPATALAVISAPPTCP